MKLNNRLINFKRVTNFTAISVKIKPAPRCLAEPGPEANWIFRTVFVIFFHSTYLRASVGGGVGVGIGWICT